MNPMYPTESVFSVLKGVLSLSFGLALLALLGFVVYKIVGSKAFRRLRDGLDLHAARTGYNRALEDANMYQEQRMLLAELKDGIAGTAAQLEELRRQQAAVVSETATVEVEREARKKMPRRKPRRIVPVLTSIPFVSTGRLGLTAPVNQGAVTAQIERKKSRRLVPVLEDIPFVSISRLGLTAPVNRGAATATP
ncbi:hypothetical protein N8J89_16700 [Crossiella sp. CA-258035]|uniref:hypothetical protein n=1 Tax=Crossiella sp. CA-258035 TaxID=2981138 RepID=UPI0024BC24CF|nr:hypothetical protein [Crossiella sp. CA-258035]WHT22638.1 hypothetical protein N8J89_16700 [Crossiella sp. CA-258035]